MVGRSAKEVDPFEVGPDSRRQVDSVREGRVTFWRKRSCDIYVDGVEEREEMGP